MKYGKGKRKKEGKERNCSLLEILSKSESITVTRREKYKRNYEFGNRYIS
jgi:hypothetical protein